MPLLGSLAGGSVKGFGGQANLGYFLGQSLRLRGDASAYLSRTFATPTSRKIFTYSLWVKPSGLYVSGSGGALLSSNDGMNTGDAILLENNNLVVMNGYSNFYRKTNALYRDPSAWYHFVFVFDSTQATGTNRIKIYVNGEQVTSFSSTTDPSLNYDFTINSAETHRIGIERTFRDYDGYMGDVYFVDGQALTPSDFGKTDPSTGQWIPKKYAGTYGTNGFYLNFRDGTSTTTLGYDYSGNSNNWTTNNISLTAGTTYDLMYDVPTLTSADKSNFATLNPLATNTVGVGTLSNGNLNFSIPNTYTVIGNMSSSSGKFYWEVVGTTNALGVGIKQVNVLDRYSNSIYYTGAQLASGQKYINGTGSAYGASWSAGDVIGVAVDMDGGNVTFYKNNVSQGAIALSLASITEFVPAMVSGAGVTFAGYVNFGQRPFAYTPPTGYKKLNTYNL